MIIKPSIRSNLFTNAHPIGCKQYVKEQIEEVKKLTPFEGPKNVLIIGGSSGYGLASRIALAYGANANTINISFESGPKGKRSGSFGWWNNIFFQQYAKETKNTHKDFIGDAFSKQMKLDVINYIKTTFGKIDLMIYSLASGGRYDESIQDVVKSSIKTIGEDAIGKTIDIKELAVLPLTVTSASEEEIKDTVFVMGGSAWQEWIEALDETKCLNHAFKTVSYTYIGGETTAKIYRQGTLGKAKEDLELAAKHMNDLLKEKYEGEALISSNKAVVTKASVFIPQMPVYVSCLFEVMMKKGLHESIQTHQYRLFSDMIYGSQRITDQEGRIRLDHLEMDDSVQEETKQMMLSIDDQQLFNLEGTKRFLKEVYQIHGFEYEHIQYDEPVEMEELSQLEPK
jgi:enoyl-[acyl-carrier protein] reductase / trans-2-enoyl-CoA reductase (NAD+)